MRKFPIIFGVLAIALSNISIAESKLSSPKFDFRGVLLGSTLQQFKENTVSIADYQDGEFTQKQTGFVVCSNDSLASEISWPEYTQKLMNIGGVSCAYAFAPQGEYKFKKALKASLEIGGYSSDAYIFNFAPQPKEAEPRLYNMVFQTAKNAAPDISAMLAKKFGKPQSVKRQTASNGFGATFEFNVSNWESKTELLEFHELYMNVNHGYLSFTSKKHNSFVEKELKKN